MRDIKQCRPRLQASNQQNQMKTVITDQKEIKSGQQGLRVLADSLIVRSEPKGKDTGRRYVKNQQIQPVQKCFADGEAWMDIGKISGRVDDYGGESGGGRAYSVKRKSRQVKNKIPATFRVILTPKKGFKMPKMAFVKIC